MKTAKYLKNFLPFVGKFSQKLSILAVLVCAFVITTSSTQAFDGRGGVDYSRSYNFGAVLRAPNGGDPVSGSRNIIDVNGNIEAGGVLGCSGLDLDALVEGQLGGMGNIGDLSKDIANAAKTRMFNEALTQLFSDPQVASVLESMQGMAQARIGMLQKNCDANQIYADATNKRLRAEAVSRCVAERRSMEDCSQADILTNYLEQVVESPRWSASLHNQMCDEDSEESCSWTVLIPNKRTQIGSQNETEADPEDTEEENTENEEEDNSVVAPASEEGEEVPPAMTAQNVMSILYGLVANTMAERVGEASAFVDMFGYSEAMRAALHSEASLPPVVQSYVQSLDRSSEEETYVPDLYTVHDYTQDQNCTFSANEMAMSQPMNNAPTTPPSSTPEAETAPESPPTPPPAEEASAPEPEPEPEEEQADSGGGSSAVVYPIPGRTVADFRMRPAGKATSDIGGRIHPITGVMTGHKGIDLAYPTGTPLVSAIAGIVTQKRQFYRRANGSRGGAGNYVDMEQGPWKVRYFHMSSFASFARGVNVGVPLRSGVHVGDVGSTGGSTGPHLHLEVHYNGQAVDPRRLFSGSVTSLDNVPAIASAGGAYPAAAAQTQLPADDPFVIALHEKYKDMFLRMSATAECMVNKTLHPQVYVKIATMPGEPGLVDIESARAEYGEVTDDMMAKGDIMAFIQGYSQSIAYDAAIVIYTAIIQEMAMKLAIRGSDGSEGINPALWEYGKGQLALLKFRRSTMVTDYVTSCETAKSISRISDRTDELERGSKSRNSVLYDTSMSKSNNFDCYKYDHLVDDGLSDLRNLYSGFQSTGAVAQLEGGDMPADPDQEINCMALNIYHEARGEDAAGQEAVAMVTMARRNHPSYPSSVCGVVWQDRQFSWTHDRNADSATDRESWQRALEIARRVQNQGIPPEYSNITAYHTTDCTSSGCNQMRNNPRLVEAFRVGNHVFYRESG